MNVDAARVAVSTWEVHSGAGWRTSRGRVGAFATDGLSTLVCAVAFDESAAAIADLIEPAGGVTSVVLGHPRVSRRGVGVSTHHATEVPRHQLTRPPWSSLSYEACRRHRRADLGSIRPG